MAKRTEKISIGTTQYTITQLGAVEGRKLYKKLITSLGPLLREAFSGIKADNDAEALVLGLVLRAIEDLPLELFEELCDSFSSVCIFKTAAMSLAIPLDTQGQFDELFAGDYGTMTSWLMANLKLNFASFLGGKATFAQAAVEPTPSV